ncbi:fructosyl amino acid oxidasesarcosine oxidase [Tricharina praecox]|uniref:fructosyl amino acid oxidasesarcosine oxidase n=1 Tax=Tricharina praecox TaxID=43433 RepID=UPI00221E8C39|nr:fructosyl amino acid oxidasesarcosine oxidase [Tricharina praecox]KAI5858505.1 fructosyl amino acid oxidasesarcosine oxidase [Tricharina praecox]
MDRPPASILIIGSGEFGLTTALSLALRPTFSSTTITLLDRLPFPAADGSSIDSSRIVRPDYSDAAYARLCHEAQTIWRGADATHPLHGIGADGRYTETGLVLTAEEGGMAYVDASYATVAKLLPELGVKCELELLETREDVGRVCRTGGGALGVRGYANWTSGWADAEGAVRFLRAAVEKTGRVTFGTGEVVGLVEEGGKVVGVRLKGGVEFRAELTVLATGAWTPGLVDLSGRSVATGQVLGYLPLSTEEWESVKEMPVVFNLSTGIFVIPQHTDHVLKIARHASGYLNPTTITDATTGTTRIVSTPRTVVTDPGLEAPAEAKAAFSATLSSLVPQFSGKQLSSTRLCWYNDTATGDFIVAYHPTKAGLFLATGGSGHAFKFLPVIGGHIVDILERKADARFASKWGWPSGAVEVVTRDGSRGDGGVQMVLELAD